METVRVFNQELSGLYESKPPISKAKMASITRSAMKAIKFYKHVVQSVEKFISKCKSEYKIPGLYVIDSIVRQSRHQFGAEKDVFAPRFARNMEQTFAHLFRCPPEDKSKIIRVLNLWQKNMVFAPETIQPLFDLANPEHPLHLQYNAAMAASAANASASEPAGGSNGMNTSIISHDSPGPMSHDDHGSSAQNSETKPLDQNTIRQLQQFQQILMRQTSGGDSAHGAGKDQVKFNKKLLDFDYGSEEDEDKNSPSVPSTSLPDGSNIAAILSDPNVLKQLQNLQKLKQHEMEEKQSKLTEMRLQEEKFEKHLASVLKKLPFANECDLSRQPPVEMNPVLPPPKEAEIDEFGVVTEVISDSHSSPRSTPADQYKSSAPSRRRKSRSRSPRDRRDRERGGRRRTRSRSRSRSHSPRRGRGGRGSSRDRERISQKDKERDKERERERKKRGLPEIKKDHLSVCSTTLWVGHLSKLVQQEELSDTFGKYGDIVSIDLIPPRGCAFIVMNRRQDAYKSMQSLKSHKMHGRTITISWATGKGVKNKEWKDYWDIDLGCSYIPWNKLSPNTDLASLEEGGMFDEDTMPQWIKDKIANATKKDEEPPAVVNPVYPVDTSQPPPPAMISMSLPPPFPMAGVPRLPMMGMPMVPGMGMNVPPPNLMMPGAMNNPPPLPMAGAGGFGVGVLPPPPPSHVPPMMNMHPPGGDEMDIEMEEEPSNHGHGGNVHPPVGIPMPNVPFFNQPPPPLLPPNIPLTGVLGFGPNDQERVAGGDQNRRGGRNRDEFERRGSRDRDRDQGGREERRGFGNDRDGGGRGRRSNRDDSDGEQRNDRPSRWGSNDRNRGSSSGQNSGNEGGRDDRPLSERLRELAERSAGEATEAQQRFGGGRNFRGGRNMNSDDDDFNQRGGSGDDFGGRRGNFQQGDRFNNNQRGGGGRFNNRGGPGFRNQRGGPDNDMPMNIMSLLNMDIFGNNGQQQEDGGDQPPAFFDRGGRGGGGGDFNNRHQNNNWNDGGGRGNRGGRGNWRDNNDGNGRGDNDRGGRFGRQNDQRSQNRRSESGGQQHDRRQDDWNQPQQQSGGSGGGGGSKSNATTWDQMDETWDDDVPVVTQVRKFEPPKEEPGQEPNAQVQERQQPDEHSPQQEYRNQSPKRQNRSPERQNRSPERQNRSPERQRHSPERQRHSPERQRHSPERQRHSPERKRHSPERQHHSPERQRNSPERQRHSPERQQHSPERQHHSPERQQQSPERQQHSPERAQHSPMHQHLSPERSPVRQQQQQQNEDERNDYTESMNQSEPQEKHEDLFEERNGPGRKRGGTPLFDELQSTAVIEPNREREMARNPSPPPIIMSLTTPTIRFSLPQPLQSRVQLYSPSPPPAPAPVESVFEPVQDVVAAAVFAAPEPEKEVSAPDHSEPVADSAPEPPLQDAVPMAEDA
ncbi:SR-related and CTD-associated factor 4 isoform X2 [Malaya genurostris]|uniref:SR-related and CTD-associated factor 4 isoform X2 n=1 Tax=Malaya genurostris TaxID=325434 RepID=UPI0026F3FDAA|nr:SR-related and CTD-associated factor 4 isoform X2 [Malaya genurostris]